MIEYLKLYEVSDKIIDFLTNAMKNWRVETIAEGQTLAEVKIQRGIFLGDTFSP